MTPRHNAFAQKILECTCHIISTIRTKTDNTLTNKNGKMVPEKVGMNCSLYVGQECSITLEFATYKGNWLYTGFFK